MPQRVRVEYSKSFTENFESTRIGGAHEFDIPDGADVQKAYDADLVFLKTVVDIQLGLAGGPGIGNQPQQQQYAQQPAPPAPVAQVPVTQVLPQPRPVAPTAPEPQIQEEPFDSEAAFGPEPSWVGKTQAPPPPRPRTQAPAPRPAPRQAAGAPPPPAPGNVARSPQAQVALPTFADVVESEPIYYPHCYVVKSEDATKNRPQWRLRLGKSGADGFPVQSYKEDGSPLQYADARSFDPAVIEDMKPIKPKMFVDVWGSWRGWSDNEDRLARNEQPMFDIMLEAVQISK